MRVTSKLRIACLVRPNYQSGLCTGSWGTYDRGAINTSPTTTQYTPGRLYTGLSARWASTTTRSTAETSIRVTRVLYVCVGSLRELDNTYKYPVTLPVYVVYLALGTLARGTSQTYPGQAQVHYR